MNKLVSIIIPTYKRSSYLPRAIESVLNQTYKNIELIIVDDNNPDTDYRKNNEEIMKEYLNDKRVKYIKHPKNMNGSAARNSGIKASSGDYVTFLDDDDFFLENRIEKIVDYLNNNNDYDGLFTGFSFVKKNKIIMCREAIYSDDYMLDVLSQNSFFGTGSNMFFRRKAMDDVGFFDESFIRHQDMEYMIRFLQNHKIANYNDISVVKCIDDETNHPNYLKLLDVKKHFLNTFESIINSYNEYNKSNIYYDNYFELLKNAEYKSPEYNDLKKKLLNMNYILKKKKRSIYIFEIKKKFRFLKCLSFVKKIKNKYVCNKILSKEKNDEIYKIIKKYSINN